MNCNEETAHVKNVVELKSLLGLVYIPFLEYCLVLRITWALVHMPTLLRDKFIFV